MRGPSPNSRLELEVWCSRTGRDLVLGRVLDDGDKALELFRGELTGTVEGSS